MDGRQIEGKVSKLAIHFMPQIGRLSTSNELEILHMIIYKALRLDGTVRD